MIHYVDGSILDSERQTLICPVNIVNTMGKGLALAMKNHFPGLENTYDQGYRTQNFLQGKFILHMAGNGKQILCFPTKLHWRNDSRLDVIDYWLEILQYNYERYGITSLAIPKLGCGEGHLKWRNVRSLIVDRLKDLPIRIDVYGDAPLTENDIVKQIRDP